MKKILLIPALIVGTLAFAGQKQVEISPMIGYNIAETDLNVKDDGYPVGGIEFQINTPGSKISPEFSVLYSEGVDYVSGRETKIARGAFNGVYTFDEVISVVPFAKLGFGYEEVTVPSSTVDDGLFADAGLGLKVPFTENIALKLEAIYMAKMATDADNYVDNNLIVMAGLTFAFGDHAQKAAPVAPVAVIVTDDDKDGVINAKDKCPNSFAGVQVDASGCELDSDNDGVVNSQDACPSSAKGAKVDPNGCAIPLDDDKDGVTNAKDKCPSTPAGTKVDMNGCDVDTDKDGVLNANDICPNTPMGQKVNSDGCPKKVDLQIHFENNSHKIKIDSQPEVKKYADFLKLNRNYSSKINGYTDSRGEASYNQKLSEKRAKSVVSELISQGVYASQLSYEGKGEVNPVADNMLSAGRAKNRRIEAELTRN